MSYAETLSRCDTTAFVTAIALVADAKRREAARRDPSIAEIQERVCARFGLGRIEMRSDRRSRYVARPRQLAMYLARQLTPRSLPQIGHAFGGRDHTTVMHACRAIERLRENDSDIDAAVRELTRELAPAEARP